MFDDLRHSLRALAKQPSFVVAGIVVLGVAVGVNTAVFSLINALLLRPLPVRASDELVYVYPSTDRVSFPYAWYLELREKTTVFRGLAARGSDRGRMRAGNELVPLEGEAVSWNYFEILGVVPPLGRAFLASDEQAPAPVVLISDALWRAHFNADPAIVGRMLTIDTPSVATRAPVWRSFTIVGVTPPGFAGSGNPWQPTQYWVLLEQRAAETTRGRMGRLGAGVVPIGRLQHGVTVAAARAAVESAGRDIVTHAEQRVPLDLTFQLRASRRVTLPFAGAYFIDVPRVIATLTAVASILLIVAAVNLAGMLMARGVARRTEIAIRLSLGVSARRLVRQLLIESTVLAAGGAVFGLFAARVLVTLAIRTLPAQLPGVNATMMSIDVPVDWRVLAFACGTCFAAALLAGVVPAIAATRTDLLSSLNAGAALAPRQTRSGLRRLVLVPQIALSLVLLLVAGVFVRTVLRLEWAPSGFDATDVVVLKYQVPPPRTLVTDADFKEAGGVARDALRRILDRLAVVPDVVSAAVTNETIQGVGLAEMQTTVIARSDYGTSNRSHGITAAFVTSGYFTTLGIPLLRGRVFDARDRDPAARTAIVSAQLGEQLWPGRNPVGEWIATHSPDVPVPPRWLEVAGVVGSVTLPAQEQPRPALYLPLESAPLFASAVLVRGHGHPSQLIDQAKRAIADASPAAMITQARTLDDAVSAVRYPRRFTAAILSASGLAGLALAALGVFALMSYSVAQRLAEIGVRMVLGAERRDVVRLIVADGLAVAGGGIALGFALAFAAVRYASHAIVPLPDADTVTFIVVPLVLIVMVLLACVLPARRAARVDPLVVLRNP